MSDCCNSKEKFLAEKAINFQKFIESHKPDDEVKRYIASFQPENLLSTIMTVVVPIVTTGSHKAAAAELVTKLDISSPDDRKAAEAKIVAYMEMFTKVIMT